MTTATTEPSADETYVVVVSQINRAVKTDDGDTEYTSMKRGEEFTAADVDSKELRRWLGLKPAVIRTKAELEAAQRTVGDQSAVIADLMAQLAEANSKLAEAGLAGADTSPAADPTGGIAPAGGATVEEPAGNASRDKWAEFALAKDPGNAEWINDAENVSRDDIRDKYKSA